MTVMTAIIIIVVTVFLKVYKGGMIIDSTDTTLIKIHSGTIYTKKFLLLRQSCLLCIGAAVNKNLPLSKTPYT